MLNIDFMHRLKSKSILLFSIPLLLGSCSSDFTSVKKFGELSAKIDELSTEVSDDIYQSCLRGLNYTAVELTYLRFGLIPSVSFEYLNGLKDAMNTKSKIVENCDRDSKAASDNFKAANQVVTAYIDALGKLATGSNFSADASIDKIGESIKGLNQLSAENPNPEINIKVDPSAVDAGTSIFKVVVNFIIQDYRKDKLQQVITCSNDDLNIYLTGNQPPKSQEEDRPPTGGLIKATQDGYIGEFNLSSNPANVSGILGDEKFRITQFRDRYLDILQLANLTEDRLQEQLNKVKTDYEEARQVVREKQNKAQAYIQILQATAVAHNLLNQEFGGENINPKDNPLCSEIIKGKTNNIPQAHNPSNRKLTDTELKRVKEILTQYQLAVETSLQQAEKNYR